LGADKADKVLYTHWKRLMDTATLGKLKGMPLRDSQKTAINLIRESERRFIVVRGPTGIGKTCLGFESIKPPFYYICSSIALQQQAMRDYPEARLLLGRGNYPCPIYGTADLCVQNKRCLHCDYEEAKAEALIAPMTVLNFHYYLTISNFTKNFPPRNVIIDEADDLEGVLTGFVSFEFSQDQLGYMGINKEMPTKKTSIKAIEAWLDVKVAEVGILAYNLEEDIKDIRKAVANRKPTAAEVRKLRQFKGLSNFKWKLDFLATQNLQEEWIFRYDEARKTITLKPIWLTRNLVDHFLFTNGFEFLFMSATIPSKEVFCGMYGIKDNELDYFDLPNVWDNTHRTIIYENRFNMIYANKNEFTFNKVKEAVRHVLGQQPGRGIIHTVNFWLAKLLEDLHDDRLIIHESKNKKELYEVFKETEGAVWVSPSSTRGLDLPDDMCEWIIWLKAPFLNLKDPQVNARLRGSGRLGKLWYASDAVQSIIQGCGRGFRHEDDYCTVYLFDEQIGRILNQRDTVGLFPMWFRDLIRYD